MTLHSRSPDVVTWNGNDGAPGALWPVQISKPSLSSETRPETATIRIAIYRSRIERGE